MFGSSTCEPTVAPESSSTSAAKLHIFDVSELKNRLGAKWSRLSDHVEQFFECAIRRGLGPDDKYFRLEELSYVILFHQASEDEAQLRCCAVSRDVCQRLFGEQGMQVRLRNLVAQIPIADLSADDETARELDALLERAGKESIISVDSESESRRRGDVVLRLRYGTGGVSSVRPDDIEFVYRPIWDALKQVVVTYLCQPTFGSCPASRMPPADFCVAQEEDDQATLDLLVLREGGARVERLHRDGLRVLVALPVAFTTLARPRSCANYMHSCQEIPAEIRRDFASLVFGIGPGVPGIRLGQEVPKLGAITKNVFCVADDVTGAGLRFAGTGARALGCSFGSSDSETRAIERVKRLGQCSREAGLDALALGVQSTSLALHAIAAGVRYLEGPAIRAASADPRHAFSQSLEYLYAEKLANVS